MLQLFLSTLPACCPAMAPTAGLLVDVKGHRSTQGAHCVPQLSYTITQLTLGIEDLGGYLDSRFTDLWPPAVQQLPQLTSLVELNMPVFNPPDGVLASALSALTSLTKLFIRRPSLREQQALPVSLKHLTVAREWSNLDGGVTSPLTAIQLTHLTALDTLVIFESHWAARSYPPPQWVDNLCYMCKGVPAGSVLPASLQHVEVEGVHRVQPLLALTQLKTLTITHGIAGLRSHEEPVFCSTPMCCWL